jgi:hypothetical protein
MESKNVGSGGYVLMSGKFQDKVAGNVINNLFQYSRNYNTHTDSYHRLVRKKLSQVSGRTGSCLSNVFKDRLLVNEKAEMKMHSGIPEYRMSSTKRLW